MTDAEYLRELARTTALAPSDTCTAHAARLNQIAERMEKAAEVIQALMEQVDRKVQFQGAEGHFREAAEKARTWLEHIKGE